MIRLLPPRTSLISGGISAAATILPIDSTFAAVIAAMIDFNAGDYFFLTLVEGNVREEIKVTDRTGNNLTIVRAQGDTGVLADVTGYAFTGAARYIVEVNKAAVEDISAGMAPVTTVNIVGTGLAEVTDEGGGNFTINVPELTLTGESGVEVVGDNPYIIGLTNDGNCCAPEEGEGEGGAVNLIGFGLIEVEDTELGWVISLAPPSFTGVGVEITGTYPNYTFTVTANGSGTVTSVAVSDGLSITGNPAVNPTINLVPTGVVADTYEGVEINEFGQIVSVPLTFAPISVLVEGDGVTLTRTADSIEIDVDTATDSTPGIVQLADAAAPLDEMDATSAVSPMLLAAVIADLEGTTGQGGATYSGEADGDYTVTLPTAAITLDLAVGEKALIMAHTTARGAVLTDPVNYAIAVFDASGNRIESNKKINQNEQNMVFFIDGPFADGLVLKHTALAGGESVPSFSLVALTL